MMPGYRSARRIAMVVIGFTLLLIGLALLLLPGPGTLIIMLGLALLATEFVWARIVLKRLKRGATQVADAARQFLESGRESGKP